MKRAFHRSLLSYVVHKALLITTQQKICIPEAIKKELIFTLIHLHPAIGTGLVHPKQG